METAASAFATASQESRQRSDYGIMRGMEKLAADVRGKLVLVFPAYEPTAALASLVAALSPQFRAVVVVDDGSRRAESRAVFDAVARTPGVRLLRHAENRGKGAALKTAFAAVQRDFPDAGGVVTADADGQHLAEDILRVTDSGR